MKKWFVSLNGTVTLSVLTLLTFLARVIIVDAMNVIPFLSVSSNQTSVASLMILIMLFFGG